MLLSSLSVDDECVDIEERAELLHPSSTDPPHAIPSQHTNDFQGMVSSFEEEHEQYGVVQYLTKHVAHAWEDKEGSGSLATACCFQRVMKRTQATNNSQLIPRKVDSGVVVAIVVASMLILIGGLALFLIPRRRRSTKEEQVLFDEKVERAKICSCTWLVSRLLLGLTIHATDVRAPTRDRSSTEGTRVRWFRTTRVFYLCHASWQRIHKRAGRNTFHLVHIGHSHT